MKPFTDVQSAIAFVDDFEDEPEELELPISDTTNDAMGLNMALVCDRILARDWMPDGFEQREGYRIYRYKKAEQRSLLEAQPEE